MTTRESEAVLLVAFVVLTAVGAAVALSHGAVSLLWLPVALVGVFAGWMGYLWLKGWIKRNREHQSSRPGE